MQSYTDLIVLAIIAGAVLLLCLLLLSFILLTRRANTQDEIIAAMRAQLSHTERQLTAKLEDALSAQQRQSKEVDRMQKRLIALEHQLDKLQRNQDDCIDSIQALKTEQGKLQVNQDVQQKLLEEHNPEHESLLQAKKLLKSGAPLDKIQTLTGMPRAELEMLQSVELQRRDKERALLKDSAEPEAFVPAGITTDEPTPALAEGATPPSIEERAHALTEAFVAQSPADLPLPSRPTASLRARTAYGIKSLRRGH